MATLKVEWIDCKDSDPTGVSTWRELTDKQVDDALTAITDILGLPKQMF